MKTLLAAFAALAFAVPAADAAPDIRFHFGSCGGPRLHIGSPRFAIELGRCRPVHHHCWQYVCEREWVAPVYQTCVVGYDHCGHPLFQTVLVCAGYWVDVRYQVCGCGARIRC